MSSIKLKQLKLQKINNLTFREFMNKRNYFFNDRNYFQQIPKYKKNKQLKRMLRIQQINQQPLKVFTGNHLQSKNSFQYKQRILNYHKVQDNSNPKAVLFWFHGINGHAGNYSYASTTLTKQLNINIYLLDLMNFGQFEGNQRGCINSFQQCLDQSQKFIVFILSKYKYLPKVFLGGHSPGGTICFHLSLKRPNYFSGVIFFAPGLRDLPNLKLVKQFVKIFGYFFPTMKTIPSRFLSSNKYDCTKLFVQDKYNYLDRLIPGAFCVALNAIQDTSKRYRQFQAAYKCFQGGVDKVVDPFGPIDLERECKSIDKTTVYYRDMWHSIPFEYQIQKIVKIMIIWLRERI